MEIYLNLLKKVASKQGLKIIKKFYFNVIL